MVNPYVLIATHQRLSITKKNIECILAQNCGVILVVSDKGEYDLFRQLFPTISVVNYPNIPLGAKWQVGVKMAQALNADPLIINGSDDILAPAFFTRADEMLRNGYHFVGLCSWYVYDMKYVYLFDYLAPMPLGGGRVYSAELLESIEYKVFDTARDRHLDDLGYHNMKVSLMRHTLLKEPLVLSVKGDWEVMNPVNKMFRSPNVKQIESYYDPEPILKKFNYAP
jgi:hypothetical protein